MTIWKKSLLSADAALRKAGLRDTVKIIGPNAANHLFLLEYAVSDKEVLNALDILSFHIYVTASKLYDDTYYQWYEDYMLPMMEIAKNAGKEIWMDEYNTKLRDDENETRQGNTWLGTQNAISMVAGMNAGLQTMLRWSIADQKWPNENQTSTDGWLEGVHRHGVTPYLLTSSIPHPSYYAYSIISRYTNGRNVKVYRGKGRNQVYLTACRLDDGSWTVIVVNSSIIAQDISVNFEKELGVSLYRRCYNPNDIKPTTAARIIDPDKTFAFVKDNLKDNIPAGGICVYTSVKG
jgi:O-glycosyl hydrolase